MATLKDALATLATVPPQAFTRERNALAARLREAGDTTTAARVKARRVPWLPVWVVNRLALEHPDDIEALIAASARVKAAQLGRGQAGTLAPATAGHRAALDRLREQAGVMLRDAGGATADKLLRVQNTLTAAAVVSKARTAFQAGHLEPELTARRALTSSTARDPLRRAAPGGRGLRRAPRPRPRQHGPPQRRHRRRRRPRNGDASARWSGRSVRNALRRRGQP